MDRDGTVTDTLRERAADWLVSLSEGDAAAQSRRRAEFEAWRQADPRHAAAAAQMQHLLDSVQSLQARSPEASRPARVALGAVLGGGGERKRRKRIGAALLGLVALSLLPALRLMAPSPFADLQTGAGEWRSHALPDGSQLTLGSGSAVTLDYDGERRRVELIRGEILVDVAADATRPFVVETRQGSLRALGTRFIVECEDESTLLTMLESRVAALPADWQGSPDRGRTVQAGERVRLTANDVEMMDAINPLSIERGWQAHQLVVRSRPLTEVLDELQRHRPGRIVYRRGEIGDLRLSAVLPLDDTDRSLRLLADVLPGLRIRRITSWLVVVDRPQTEPASGS